MLAEAKKAAEERKRACSVGDTLQSPKRGCVGCGKPRGRRGGRRQGSATEKNMERLSDILSSCPTPEPRKSSASSCSFRQQKASERWKEARPHHLQCLLEKEAVGHPLCGLCHEPAVIRCRECLPEEWFCGDCDVLHHKKQPLHNRDSFINGFFKPISPTTCVVRVEGGYDTRDQACILPTVKAPNCSCKGTNFTVTQGRGTCGDSQWTAARETSRRASKLDEEGMEVAVCRHGFLLKALNMYRGEIFAYPLYLQKELMPAKAKFYAMDVACKYWPYMEKAASVLPALQELTTMKPFVSVMHARAHATKCEQPFTIRLNGVGRTRRDGAGMTAGEEVEQVNSYLSRCALTTKYMSKAARLDMLTVHAMGWNRKKGDSLHQALSTRYVKTSKRLLEETASLEELKAELHCVSDDMVSTWISDVKEWASETSGTSEDILQTALQQSIEGLYLSVRQRKQSLYRQNDSSKLRHRLRRKLADDKKRLNQEILKYNQLVHDSARGIDAAVEHSLSGGSIMSALWPWEVHGMANFTAKKRILAQVMLTRRLQEEKGILLLEMAQHCTWLQNMAVALKNKVAEEDVDQGNGGLGCTLRRKHSEASERLQVVLQQYKTALGPDASFLQQEEESQSGLSSPDTSEDEEGNII
ncbi:hypothetical protein NQZ68_015575 [Dissostichus eleginoides]|nr:hypothetical protein NQZ68_015575 [Dissostichus eleginoides]